MSLNPALGRRGVPPPPPPRTHIEFDFVVAKRPRYIPGSGPPLAPILPMPAHDKDGYIVKEVMIYSELRYLVGYEELPHLRVSVKLPNILNWVSPRALEQYHNNKVDEQEREREEIELPLIKAREERKRKRLEKLSRDGVATGTQSRKRKRTPDDLPFKARNSVTPSSSTKKRGCPPGPGRRNQPVEEEVSFTSPKQSQHSQQQPSLSAPGGALANRTVLDSDSDDEDSVATEMALEYQLKGGKAPPSNRQSSRSARSSPSATAKRSTRSRSASKPVDTSREESPSVSTPQTTQFRRSHHLPPFNLSSRGAMAATSTHEALQVYEDLERKDREPQTLADKYSYTRKASQSQTFKLAHVGLAGSSRGLAHVVSDDGAEEEEAEDESEYELKCILNDEIRFTKDGKTETWYLIKWAGEWDDTWEPSENVADGAIKEYEAEKLKKKGRRGSKARDGEESDLDSLFMSDRKGKGKEVKRGQVIDDDDDDSEDDEIPADMADIKELLRLKWLET